ncbi:MAG: prolyl oligopeptidase family serine peptidase [Clostridia bacterium]|nr:prolyl oligopeptidase family serine peptidase [Clostridia bacterium]
MKQWDGLEVIDNWHGFSIKDGRMMDRDFIIVCPKEGTANGKWALKTEYFGAFPETEIELLKRGYHVASIKNKTRWATDEDMEAFVAFCKYVHEELGLSKKCVPVGMSCGGQEAILLAGKHPELVSCMYIDAPVINYLSCPVGLGKRKKGTPEEFLNAKGMTLIDLLSYREHPLDFIPNLVENKIPVILLSGDADSVVPFDENGELLKKAYEKAGCIIETIMRPGGDHHPHGLPDVTPICDFIDKYSY